MSTRAAGPGRWTWHRRWAGRTEDRRSTEAPGRVIAQPVERADREAAHATRLLRIPEVTDGMSRGPSATRYLRQLPGQKWVATMRTNRNSKRSLV